MYKKIFDKKTGRISRGQNGSALIMGLVSVLVLGIISTSYVTGIVTEQRNTLRTETTLSALTVAEAGAEYGIWEVLYGGTDFAESDGWQTSGSNKIFNAAFKTADDVSQGEYDITYSTVDNNIILTTVGYVPSKADPFARSTVQVKLTPYQIFNQAVFGVDSISLKSNALVDSYNSVDGDYSETVSSNGDVVVNSIEQDAIELGSNVEVQGDIYAGAGGDPETVIKDNGATISGTEKVLTAGCTLPVVPIPAALANPEESLTVKKTDSLPISGELSYIDVTVKGTLTITGDTTIYVENNFSVQANATLVIAPGAHVEIIVGKSLDLMANSIITIDSEDPADFGVYGLNTCTDIKVNSNSKFYGTIYGPQADFSLNGNSEVFGAVAAKTVTMGSQSALHYDESLMDEDRSPSFGYEIANWQTK